MAIKVNAFGPRLDLELHQNPEEFLDGNPEAEEQLVEVAQSAFSKPGVPTDEDSRAHMRTDELVTAEVNGEYVAFSGVDLMDNIIYEVGVAVDDDLQGYGVGGVVMTRGISSLYSSPEDQRPGFRTQNPRMLQMASDHFDVYPLPGKETSPDILEEIQELGNEIDGTKEMDGPVMREAYSDIYDGGMYSEVPSSSLEDFMYEELDMEFEDGDGLMVIGEFKTDRTYRNPRHKFGRAVKRCSHDVYEDGEEVNIDPLENFNWVHGPSPIN